MLGTAESIDGLLRELIGVDSWALTNHLPADVFNSWHRLIYNDMGQLPARTNLIPLNAARVRAILTPNSGATIRIQTIGSTQQKVYFDVEGSTLSDPTAICPGCSQGRTDYSTFLPSPGQTGTAI